MGSEEKLARASELSRVGDAQWDCSGESSMPRDRSTTRSAVSGGGGQKVLQKTASYNN